MDLKERFENYESVPDERVWQNVQRGLRRRKMMRYSAVAGLLAAVTVAAAILFKPVEVATENVTPIVLAEQEPSMQQAVVQEAILPSEETAPQLQQAKVEPRSLSEDKPAVTIEPNEVQHPILPIAEVATTGSEAEAKEKTSLSAQEQTTVVAIQEMEPIQPLQQQGELARSEERSETTSEEPRNKLQIVQQDYEVQVWVPNAFSPDDPGGGEVCTFKAVPKERSNIKSFKMYIYNRAGSLVFQSVSIDEAWDGTCRGEKCPAGNYVYILELNDEYAGLQHSRGSVLLIR